jgi:hypothetical protein
MSDLVESFGNAINELTGAGQSPDYPLMTAVRHSATDATKKILDNNYTAGTDDNVAVLKRAVEAAIAGNHGETAKVIADFAKGHGMGDKVFAAPGVLSNVVAASGQSDDVSSGRVSTAIAAGAFSTNDLSHAMVVAAYHQQPKTTDLLLSEFATRFSAASVKDQTLNFGSSIDFETAITQSIQNGDAKTAKMLLEANSQILHPGLRMNEPQLEEIRRTLYDSFSGPHGDEKAFVPVLAELDRADRLYRDYDIRAYNKMVDYALDEAGIGKTTAPAPPKARPGPG